MVSKESKMGALTAALAQIEKQFGKGSIMRMGDDQVAAKLDVVSTGSLGLDIALGVGGLPRGRVVEVYGPESSGKTLLCLSAIANAQRQGLTCAFIDAEHALDPVWASTLGVNVGELYISQPDNGEQALEIADTLVRSGAFGMVVIDSVAALVPKAEIEGEMGASLPGLQARLMSQALRKLTGSVKASNTLLVFINQLRMKIGVMFGCLHADTLVNFVDGRSLPIREVVENKVEGEVWSWNEELGIFEAQPIVDWHYNGDVTSASDYIHIQTTSVNGHGRFGLTVTPSHEVLTQDGWKEAKDLTTEDRLISKYWNRIGGTLGQFLAGSLAGDMHLARRDKSTACLKIQDSLNPEYAAWKVEMLTPHFSFKSREYTGHGKMRTRFESNHSYELSLMKDRIGQRCPLWFLEHEFSWLGFAVWLMDDGHYDSQTGHSQYSLSIKRLRHEESKLNQVVAWFNEKLGLECRATSDGTIHFSTGATQTIAANICKFVPECMQHKLPLAYRGQFVPFVLETSVQLLKTEVAIKAIRQASPQQMRQKGKYDISVAKNHNYMVGGAHNGVVVHNSPETTTGGNALKFYASVRIDVRRVGTIKKGDEVTGAETKAKVIKNKVAPPFREALYDIIYGRGISRHGELVEMGVKIGVVDKSGAWYSYKGEKIGQGKDNSVNFLMANPAIADEIDRAIRAHYKVAAVVQPGGSEDEGSPDGE